MSKERSEVRVSYDPVGDTVVVRWADPVGIGAYDVTDNEDIAVCLDDENNIVGFMVEHVSLLKKPAHARLAVPRPISVRAAAKKIGVTERRVRQLITEGRLKAKQQGKSWVLEPSLEVLPAKRGRPKAASAVSKEKVAAKAG